MRRLEELEEAVPRSCARRTRRRRRSAARSRRSSPPSTTCSGWRAWTTPSPSRSSRPGRRGWPATASRTPALLCELKVDGLAINLLYERRPAGPGAHPRRRAHRRGRHAQRQDHRRRSRTCSPAPTEFPVPGAGRGARRGVPARPRPSSGSTPRWPRPASRCSPTRATPRPGRCGRRTRGSPRPGRSAWSATASARGEGFEPTAQSAAYAALRGLGPADQRPGPGAARPRRGRGVHRALRRAPPRRRARDRRRGGQGRRRRAPAAARLDLAGRRGGRSRSSTRPRRSTPGCCAIEVNTGRTGRVTPVRRDGADQGGRLDGRERHPAQRPRGPAQGRPPRRHRDPAQGRRRDPRDRRPGAAAAARGAARSG